MKKLIIPALCLCGILTGCNATYCKKGDVTVFNARLFWDTEKYNIHFTTNSASLTANGSKSDSEGLGSAVGAGIATYQKSH